MPGARLAACLGALAAVPAAVALAAGPAAVPNLSGSWSNPKDPASPAWQLSASGSGYGTLRASWRGGAGHAGLTGSFVGSLSGNAYRGTMRVVEGSLKVTGTMTITIVDEAEISMSYQQSNGPHGAGIVMRRNEHVLVFFNPTSAGIAGNVQLETFGARDGNGAYPVREVHVVGSPEPLRITSGVFGQHTLRLAFVSGRYQPANLVTAQTLTLHLRVVASDDGACAVGSNGLLTAWVNHRHEAGTELALCGQDTQIRGETVRITTVPD